MTIGFALAARAQDYPTNFVNFSDLEQYISPVTELSWGTGAGMQWPTAPYYTNLAPSDIGMALHFQMYSHSDQGPSPLGSTINIDTQGGSKITFTSPVVLWSMAVHSLSSPAQVQGKKGGVLVWSYTGPAAWAWDTMTNGAGKAIDEIDFVENWNARYTDLFLQDASAIATPLLSALGVAPEAAYRGLGVPVNLIWDVDPTATVTIDNGIGDVTYLEDPMTGAGSLAISPNNTTTYTLTATLGTNTQSAKVTVKGSVLPPTVGFMTFEDLTGAGSVPPAYTWNAPVGVNLAWLNWGVSGGSGSGTPYTANAVWPQKWGQLDSTNSMGATNNASIQFQDDVGNPLPVMVNSFAVMINTNLAAPDPVGWGPVHVEGLLAGVVQWTFDESEAVMWENIVTKGTGIPIDEMRFSGFYYQYDNFAISTVAYPTPVLTSPAAQNGQFQFSWKSVADWAGYAVMQKSAVTDPWTVQSQGGVGPAPKGTTNTVSLGVNTNCFFKVLRVP